VKEEVTGIFCCVLVLLIPQYTHVQLSFIHTVDAQRSELYRVGQKSKPLPIFQKIVFSLNRIKNRQPILII